MHYQQERCTTSRNDALPAGTELNTATSVATSINNAGVANASSLGGAWENEKTIDASEGLNHRVFDISLAGLQNDEDHSYRKIHLRAEDGRVVVVGYKQDTTPFVGSSADAIVCVVVGSGASMKEALQAIKVFAEDCRSRGTTCSWSSSMSSHAKAASVIQITSHGSS
ncbi:hypothetical protein Tco_0670937 [Tanacetum coccineum]